MACLICGSPIGCVLELNDLYFYIDENGEVQYDENQELWEPDGFLFHCTNDLTHDIAPPEDQLDDYDKWSSEFVKRAINIIREKNIYEKKWRMFTGYSV